MDLPTKVAFALLALMMLGIGWWLWRGARQQRRRARAEAWARGQISAAADEGATNESAASDEDEIAVPRPRDGRHHGCQEAAVTVPELLERAVQEGDPVRLNWPADALDHETGLVRPYIQDEFPTGVIPRLAGLEWPAEDA